MKTYSVKEIAEMLNTNPETVRRWIRSGKLEAIQESRKSGNVVTGAMLETFLKDSPKYAGIAAGLSPISFATGGIFGGILAWQLIKNGELENAYVNASEIKTFLMTNIQLSRESIERKKESIQHLRDEITAEEKKIVEAENLIKELEKQTKVVEEN